MAVLAGARCVQIAAKRPARARANRERFVVAGAQPPQSRHRDHRRVVGAEFDARITNRDSKTGRRRREPGTQHAVCADTAGNYQCPEAGLMQRTARLRDQRLDDGRLEGRREIGALGCADCATADQLRGGRLQATEAEIEARSIEHRPRQGMAIRPALERQPLEVRASGIRQPQELRGLVESLARRIIDRLPEHPVIAEGTDIDQQGVSPGNQQGQERKLRRIRLEHGSHQMSFQMMDTDRRAGPGICKASPKRRPHQKGADEARAGSVGHGIDIRR